MNPKRPPGGPCARCQNFNAYSKYTCDTCGDRLPWADTFAATSGEKCPVCGVFNPYLNSACSSCAAPLPWAHAAAPQRAAKTCKVQGEQKSLALVAIAVGIAIVVACGFLITTLPVR
jgi:DNA-directed RNA polymerase subunit RPC12/RpoP